MDGLEVMKLVYNGTMAGAVIIVVILFLKHLKGRDDAADVAEKARQAARTADIVQATTSHEKAVAACLASNQVVMTLIAKAQEDATKAIVAQLDEQCDRLTAIGTQVNTSCKAKSG